MGGCSDTPAITHSPVTQDQQRNQTPPALCVTPVSLSVHVCTWMCACVCQWEGQTMTGIDGDRRAEPLCYIAKGE